MHDVIIIGAGAAGQAAAIFSVRQNLKTLVLSKTISEITEEEGLEFNLTKIFYQILKDKPDFLELKTETEITNIEKNVVSFSAETKQGKIYYCSCAILAYGAAESQPLELITDKDFNNGIKVDSEMRTNIAGLFAAGKAIAGGVESVFAAAGQGAQAAYSVKNYLESKKNLA